ncbi:MAG: hypothetical protein FJX23_01660 [Alphaproteobacteria bacterium]|nr:hypothetical protein [Alphaproteobacteria bacterium]
MAAINLGSMYNSGGKTVISGGNSGLDTEALVKSLVDAKRLPAVQLEGTIEKNGTKVTALNDLKSILEALQTSSNFLRNVPGIGNATQNVFAYSTATVKASSGITSSTYLTATVAAGTAAGSYEITIDQLATRQNYVTNTIAVADTATSVVGGGGAFNAGIMKLGTAGTEVTLADGDSLSDVAAKINAVKAQSGVEASVVKVSDGNYRLVMKSTATGAAQNFDFNTENPGILNVGFFSQTDAVDALVTIDGTQVSRATNTITDLVDGVTLNLTAQTPVGTTLTVDVIQDTSLAKDAIMNFVDAYNELRAFAARQNATDDEGVRLESAVLSSSNALRTLNNSFGADIASIVEGLSGTINSLSSIGITLTDYAGDAETPLTRNILKVDESLLDAALKSDFDAVRKVFEFNATFDNPDVLVFSHSKNTNVTDVAFDFDTTSNTFTATFTLNGSTQSVTLIPTSLGDGYSLKAPDDSPLAGLTLIYGSTQSATVNMQMTQGIGDKIYNTVTNSLNATDGIIAQEITSINDRNTRMQEDIERIDVQIEKYREALLTKFSALESAISSVNNILALLDAQAAARENG